MVLVFSISNFFTNKKFQGNCIRYKQKKYKFQFLDIGNLWGQNRLIHTQILVQDWVLKTRFKWKWVQYGIQNRYEFFGLVGEQLEFFFAIYSQLEHSFHTWPSDASRIESDLMSRWMTPCECRYAIAFRHCLQTVAICSSSSLQKKKCESFFILNAHRPT